MDKNINHCYLTIHIDGASRKNPGEAGAGILIKDDKGNIIAELNKYLGIATNNEAEYMALITALEYLSTVKQKPLYKSVAFFSDSQLLVNQMNGEYSVKSPNILPLYQKAKKILRNIFKNVLPNPCTFTYIPRELNKHADKLANLAIDSKC